MALLPHITPDHDYDAYLALDGTVATYETKP